MSVKKLVLVVAVTATCIAGGLAAKRQGKQAPSAEAFTVTQIESIYEAQDPIVAFTRTTTIAVRNDGSYAQLSHFSDPTGGVRSWVRRGIRDLRSREFISVDPFSESISTYPMSAATLAHESKMFRGSCNGDSAGMILGYEVILQRNSVDSPGDIVDHILTSSWSAPALRCFPLRTEILIYSKGKLTQRTIKMAINVDAGEAPAWIFEPPKNYTERTPSEARGEAEKRYPTHDCCKNNSVGSAEADKIYNESRSGSN